VSSSELVTFELKTLAGFKLGSFLQQVSDDMKAHVPEEVLKAARQINRKAYEDRLRQIRSTYFHAIHWRHEK
jgi:hypothetical protein